MTERAGAWLGTVIGTSLLLIGVLAGEVSVSAMLLAAWVENISAGAATVVALVRAPGGRLVLSPTTQVSGIPIRHDADGTRTIPSGCAAGFFAAHFGMFTLVHGTFLATAIAMSGSGSGVGGERVGLGGLALVIVLLAATFRAFRRVDPRRAIAQAYAGLVPLHLAVLLLFTLVLDVPAARPARWPALLIIGLLVGGDLIRAAIGRRSWAPPSGTPVTATPPPPGA